MTEYEDVDFCERCGEDQIFTYAGSGNKRVCSNCFEFSIKPIGRTFKAVRRIEDEDEVIYDYD